MKDELKTDCAAGLTRGRDASKLNLHVVPETELLSSVTEYALSYADTTLFAINQRSRLDKDGVLAYTAQSVCLRNLLQSTITIDLIPRVFIASLFFNFNTKSKAHKVVLQSTISIHLITCIFITSFYFHVYDVEIAQTESRFLRSTMI